MRIARSPVDLAEFMQGGRFADCHVEVVNSKGESKAFPAHKIVLVASSNYFRKIFDSSTNSESNLQIAMEHDSFEAILAYIYVGQVDVSMEEVERFVNGITFLGVAQKHPIQSTPEKPAAEKTFTSIIEPTSESVTQNPAGVVPLKSPAFGSQNPLAAVQPNQSTSGLQNQPAFVPQTSSASIQPNQSASVLEKVIPAGSSDQAKTAEPANLVTLSKGASPEELEKPDKPTSEQLAVSQPENLVSRGDFHLRDEFVAEESSTEIQVSSTENVVLPTNVAQKLFASPTSSPGKSSVDQNPLKLSLQVFVEVVDDDQPIQVDTVNNKFQSTSVAETESQKLKKLTRRSREKEVTDREGNKEKRQNFWMTNSPSVICVGYHCKDKIFGEMTCNSCLYTSFNKVAIIKHVRAKHHWGTTAETRSESADNSQPGSSLSGDNLAADQSQLSKLRLKRRNGSSDLKSGEDAVPYSAKKFRRN